MSKNKDAAQLAAEIFAKYGDATKHVQADAELEIEMKLLLLDPLTESKLAEVTKQRDGFKDQLELAHDELRAFDSWKSLALRHMTDLLNVLGDVMDYRGGASNALEDEGVVERLKAAIKICSLLAKP